MEAISFDDPHPNRVENAILDMFREFASKLQEARIEWHSDVGWHLRRSFGSRLRSFRGSSEPESSELKLEIFCRRRCCKGFGGAPEHLMHSLEIRSEFGMNNVYPKWWRISGSIDNFDPELDEVPIARFLTEVQFDEVQPDEVFLKEVRKKLDDLPMVLDYVSKDTTRWTKREY